MTYDPILQAANPVSLSEQLVHSTVRIRARKMREQAWAQVGTGFYWNSVVGGGHEISAIITARHVLQGADELEVQLHLRSAQGGPIAGPGREFIIEGSRLRCVLHPDPAVDLALIALGPTIHAIKPPPFFRSLTATDLPDEAVIEALPAVQDILMVGYPTGLADGVNNYPIIRRGTTAIPPWIDYEGRKDLLCDVAVFPGSSGSPVFVVHEGSRTLRDGSTQYGIKKLWLLGVLYGGPYYTPSGQIEISPNPDAEPNHIPIHLGLCVKAVRVRELVAHALQEFSTT